MPTSNQGYVDPFDNPAFDPTVPQVRPPQAGPVAQTDYVDPFDDPSFNMQPPVKPAPRAEGSLGPEEMAMFQGLTFGFGDEIIGGVRSMMPGSPPYSETVDQERKAYQQYSDENPWKSLGYEAVGGAPWALLSGGASAAGTVARGAGKVYDAGKRLFKVGDRGMDEAAELFGGPAGQSITNGATSLGQRVTGGLLGAGAEGALSGAGHADGDIKDRLQGAGIGFGIGAGVGAAAPLVADGVRGVTRMAQDATGLFPKTTAERKILQQFERDRALPRDVKGDMEFAGDERQKPEIMADYLPGGNVSSLTEALAQKMGPTKQAARELMDSRTDGQSERVLTDLRDVFGKKMNYFDKFDKLVEDRATVAKKDYDTAYAVGEVNDDQIKDLLGRLPPKVFSSAKEILKLEGRSMPDAFIKDAEGNLVSNPAFVPTVEYLDLVKRGIDNAIDSETNTGKVSTLGRAYAKTKDQLLTRLDEVVPEYATARKNFRDPSQMIDAMKLGQDIFKERAEKTQRNIADMNDNEKEAFIIGVSDALVKRVDDVSTGRDVTQTLWKNETQKKQIREAIAAVEPDEDQADVLFERLERMMDREREMVATRNRMHGGSQTAPRTEAINDFNRVIPAGIAELASGGTGAGAAVNAIGTMFKRGGLLSRHDAINDEAGSILLASTPEAREAAFARLLGRQDKMAGNARGVGQVGDALANLIAQEAGQQAGVYANGRPVYGLLNVPEKKRY